MEFRNICPSVRSRNRKKVVYHIRSIHYYQCLRCQPYCLIKRDLILDHVQCIRYLPSGYHCAFYPLYRVCVTYMLFPCPFLCHCFHESEDKKLKVFSTHMRGPILKIRFLSFFFGTSSEFVSVIFYM